jgi:hypothetical protein
MELNPLTGGSGGQLPGGEVNFPRDGDLHQVAIPISEGQPVFSHLDATLERLRVDRQLDEALSCGPDALHLAAVFGLDDKTAIRYADNARQLLQGSAEDQDSAPGSCEPKDQNGS